MSRRIGFPNPERCKCVVWTSRNTGFELTSIGANGLETIRERFEPPCFQGFPVSETAFSDSFLGQLPPATAAAPKKVSRCIVPDRDAQNKSLPGALLLADQSKSRARPPTNTPPS